MTIILTSTLEHFLKYIFPRDFIEIMIKVTVNLRSSKRQMFKYYSSKN